MRESRRYISLQRPTTLGDDFAMSGLPEPHRLRLAAKHNGVIPAPHHSIRAARHLSAGPRSPGKTRSLRGAGNCDAYRTETTSPWPGPGRHPLRHGPRYRSASRGVIKARPRSSHSSSMPERHPRVRDLDSRTAAHDHARTVALEHHREPPRRAHGANCGCLTRRALATASCGMTSHRRGFHNAVVAGQILPSRGGAGRHRYPSATCGRLASGPAVKDGSCTLRFSEATELRLPKGDIQIRIKKALRDLWLHRPDHSKEPAVTGMGMPARHVQIFVHAASTGNCVAGIPSARTKSWKLTPRPHRANATGSMPSANSAL